MLLWIFLIIANLASVLLQLSLAINNVDKNKSPIVHLLIMIMNMTAVAICCGNLFQ